ncbi:hypothetical protein QN277_005614 [Acacia crassicarpa]|uniref:Uncharacterized protein n=1 Tax=Acacia crassicarpa TaxID=499986 RepID=A0AAE1IWP5_9FABA|nr:hypothetical protein QN277_005614 [Acacia crassicarpa]
MSTFIRRAFSYRNLLLLRSSSLYSPDLSRTIKNPIYICNSNVERVFRIPAANFIIECRRGFAKGRKSSMPFCLFSDMNI